MFFDENALMIGEALTTEQEEQLVILLSRNLDLFAWSIKDVPGIDPNFINHHLSLDKGVKPIAQMRRKTNAEKSMSIQKETTNLLESEFIPEVHTPHG